ncbi:hypothetical protein C5O22_06190 [Treponema sp. J25]|nr:hypothetical protein C5O22_06190 [Treponema sp. J25]
MIGGVVAVPPWRTAAQGPVQDGGVAGVSPAEGVAEAARGRVTRLGPLRGRLTTTVRRRGKGRAVANRAATERWGLAGARS